MKAAELYDVDFAEWARTNAELLRAGCFTEIDLEQVAEEIADLGKSERHGLHSRFVQLIEHLLKWEYQPERCGSSWRRTIAVQRTRIPSLLVENPSFRSDLPELVASAYRDAVRIVATVIQRKTADFPQGCPFSIQQLLDHEFWPDL